MSTATRPTDVAGAVARTLGSLMTYRRAGTGAGVSLAVVLTQRSAAVWADGGITVNEQHQTGYILAAGLSPDPAIGDTLTGQDGTGYEIDQAPAREHGLWSLVLRRLP